MMIGSERFGYIALGKSVFSRRDMRFEIAAVRKKDAVPGEIAWRFLFSITWDWPKFELLIDR